MAQYTWTTKLLYETPTIGDCAVTGDRETGRHFFDAKMDRVFVGDTAAPHAVEDWAGFMAALGTVNHFKRGYPKRDWIAEQIPAPKKAKK